MPPTATLRSFRLVCPPEHIPLVEALLHAEGYAFAPEPFSPWCRALESEPRPLGSSLAAIFGYIYIQDRSSMLPPLALMPQEGSAVLDMCASPGSKTGFVAQLTGKTGFVLGNEPARPRLATLRANLQQLGFLHTGTCSGPGEALPLPEAQWDCIQLDPPCSGWGTVEKNPQVLKLWQGDKVKPLVGLQRLLLQKAARLLRPGGTVVYSTCTTNEEENEAQVRYAVEELGLTLDALPPFEGFVWEEPHPGGEGTLRVDGERSRAQGFYIAKLRKPANPPGAQGAAEAPEATEAASARASGTTTTTNFSVQEALDPHMLDSPCTDISLLPPGILASFGDTARFVPEAALRALPADFVWQAAPLGRLAGGRIRLAPRCRALMPAQPPQEALVLENIADIHALLCGQSLLTGLSGNETGLYYGHTLGALPLGRAGLKKGRALWSAK